MAMAFPTPPLQDVDMEHEASSLRRGWRGAGRSQAHRNLPWEIWFRQGEFLQEALAPTFGVGLVLGERRSPDSSPGSSVEQERPRDRAAAPLEGRSTKYHQSTALMYTSSPQMKFSVSVWCIIPRPHSESKQRLSLPLPLLHPAGIPWLPHLGTGH